MLGMVAPAMVGRFERWETEVEEAVAVEEAPDEEAVVVVPEDVPEEVSVPVLEAEDEASPVDVADVPDDASVDVADEAEESAEVSVAAPVVAEVTSEASAAVVVVVCAMTAAAAKASNMTEAFMVKGWFGCVSKGASCSNECCKQVGGGSACGSKLIVHRPRWGLTK